ncbi:isopeptide-forming domain-containing fimbrial protein [bacterium D16-76]|nr:isopeptide-forming domain-containing fimbrial protein [bacterium D16-76]
MKSLKKFFALALALALCFVMALPAMAADEATPPPVSADEKTTLQIKDNTFGHAYTIYQLFVGDVSTNDAGERILSNVKYGSAGFGGEGTPVPDSVLQKFTSPDGEYYDLNNFVKEHIKDLESFKDGWKGESIEVMPGYYIIVDENKEETEAGEADSAYIVQVVGPTAVAPKTTVPELDKTTDSDKSKYQPELDEAAGNATDKYGHKIGEVFPFDLKASIPVEYLSKFDTYKLVFHDEMSEGLSFKEGFTVKVDGKEISAEYYKVTGSVVNEDNTIGTDIAGADFALTIEDLFALIGGKENIPAGGNIVVTVHYTAYLNEKSLVWDTDANGNTNSAHLEFSRDPNNGEEMGTTPPDVVTIFTFDLDGLKTDGDGNALAGAGFTLYGEDGKVIPLYVDNDGNYFVWEVTDENPLPDTLTSVESNEIRSGEDGKFVINGLKPGKYILKETTVPTGFNKAPDMEITVTIAGYEQNEDGKNIPILDVSKKYIETEGVGDVNTENQVGNTTDTTVEIVNKKGTLLPSTGGIGTTIFYAVGGVLVVGAGVLLIVKKRLGSKG